MKNIITRAILSNMIIKIKIFWKSLDVITRYFLLIGTCAGLLMVFLVPPLFGFDETTHYKAVNYWTNPSRTINVNDSSIVRPVLLDSNVLSLSDAVNADFKNEEGRGNFAPRSYDQLYIQRNSETRVVGDLSGAAIYSPIGYIHEIIATKIGQVLRFPLLIQIYFARLANLALYLILIALAIQLIPFAKWGVFLIGLLPMSLFQAGTINMDASLTGFTVLFTALVLNLVFNKNARITKVVLAALVTSLLFIVMSKVTYVFIIVLLLLIPYRKFGSMQRKIITSIIIFAPSLLAFMAWNTKSRDYIDRIAASYRPGFDISSSEQLTYILGNPIRYAGTVWNDLIRHGSYYFQGMFGTFDLTLNLIPIFFCIPIFFLIFISANIEESHKILLTRQHKVALLAVIFLVAMSIMGALYLSYTPLKNEIIDGVQGRYFIPLLIILLPLLKVNWLSIEVKKPARVYIPASIFVLIYSFGFMIMQNVLIYK